MIDPSGPGCEGVVFGSEERLEITFDKINWRLGACGYSGKALAYGRFTVYSGRRERKRKSFF